MISILQISRNLDENIQTMQSMFGGDKTIVLHRFEPRQPGETSLKCCLFYIDGMVNSMTISRQIISPITGLSPDCVPEGDACAWLESRVFSAGEIYGTGDLTRAIDNFLYGDTLIFVEGSANVLVAGTKGFEKRSISEPDGEMVMKGPREGFIEPLLQNMAMLRRKVRSSNLRFESFSMGGVTQTSCCYCYIEGVVDKDVLQSVKRRMAEFEIDGVFDSNYLAAAVRDHKLSIVNTVGSSERPDVVAAKLLEGRVAIMVDGSPVVLTAPCIFLEHFQSPEDYYVELHFAAFNRALRAIGFLLTISLVPIYMAFTMFNQEFLPSPLLFSLAASRQGVLLPTVVEALVLLFAFDILREAGTRTPAGIGQVLSIVGCLVVGQAAVEARFISEPMLIIVAFSGITGLIAPKLKPIVIFMRFFLIALVCFMGLYGYVFGMCYGLLSLSRSSSFGVPLLSNLPLVSDKSASDSFIRPSFLAMKKYGRFLSRGRKND